MGLISYSEADGKKLYHITTEGLAYLQERSEEEQELSKANWEESRHHRQRGERSGKHALRGLMKEWSELIQLMATMEEYTKEHPNTEQAVKFQELMNGMKHELQHLQAVTPSSSSEEQQEF